VIERCRAARRGSLRGPLGDTDDAYSVSSSCAPPRRVRHRRRDRRHRRTSGCAGTHGQAMQRASRTEDQDPSPSGRTSRRREARRVRRTARSAAVCPARPARAKKVAARPASRPSTGRWRARSPRLEEEAAGRRGPHAAAMQRLRHTRSATLMSRGNRSQARCDGREAIGRCTNRVPVPFESSKIVTERGKTPPGRIRRLEEMDALWEQAKQRDARDLTTENDERQKMSFLCNAIE